MEKRVRAHSHRSDSEECESDQSRFLLRRKKIRDEKQRDRITSGGNDLCDRGNPYEFPDRFYDS